ncbi:MAG: hypothetical protein IJ999_06050, partial [Clostridia bacterium]|nr:hypothetical protein [Clostridia bacterium]
KGENYAKNINVYLLVDTSIYAKQGLPKLQKMLMGIHGAKPLQIQTATYSTTFHQLSFVNCLVT